MAIFNKYVNFIVDGEKGKGIDRQAFEQSLSKPFQKVKQKKQSNYFFIQQISNFFLFFSSFFLFLKILKCLNNLVSKFYILSEEKKRD